MGVLQDFERRLEGAVEGFFARTFRSGLQPIELAKALQRYAEDTQHVTEDGVVVPNVYRFALNGKDLERLRTFGEELAEELRQVVVRTADERGWRLRGPVMVRTEVADDVPFGMYELTGRIEQGRREPPPRPQPSGRESGSATRVAAPAAPAAGADTTAGPAVRIVSGGEPRRVRLTGRRMSAGRLPTADISLDDGTVSRQHAVFVLRAEGWWVVDLGSTNGTRVNGVSAAEHALQEGDRVELGEAVLEFVGT